MMDDESGESMEPTEEVALVGLGECVVDEEKSVNDTRHVSSCRHDDGLESHQHNLRQ